MSVIAIEQEVFESIGGALPVKNCLRHVFLYSRVYKNKAIWQSQIKIDTSRAYLQTATTTKQGLTRIIIALRSSKRK